MNRSSTLRVAATYVVTALCCFGGACTAIDWSAVVTTLLTPEELEAGFEALESLEPELAFVVDNRELFAYDGSEPLYNLPPGTVMDDISDLDGCWGTALFTKSNFGDRPLFALYFVHKFDAATGEYTIWILGDQLGLVSPYEDAGTFSVEDERRIETRTFDTKSYLVTRQGDQMRLRFGPVDRDPVDRGDDELYTRFDCPE